MTAALVLAAFAQVLLTLWALIAMGRARIAWIRDSGVGLGTVALDDSAYPEAVQKLQANTRNQFETPVLFFAGIAVALAIGADNGAVAGFAWGYVASRVLHRRIHVGSNDVRKRFKAFVFGLACLFGLWCALVGDLLLA